MEKHTEKKGALIIATTLLATIALICYNHDGQTKPTLEDFFTAIATVESNNDTMAQGADGEIGAMQIMPAFWSDSIEYRDIGGTHFDCYSREYSKMIMEGYFRRYAENAWLAEDWHSLARIHHGGWNGMNRKHTKQYADRVIAIMEVQNNG